MRIRTALQTYGSSIQAFVSASVECASLGIKDAKIDLLVDTGSTRTLISERDAEKMGISVNNLNMMKSKALVVGGQADLLELPPMLLFFSAEDEGGVKRPILVSDLRMCVVRVPVPAGLPEEECRRREEAKSRNSSMLGADFFLHTQYRLIFDPHRQEVYIEI